MISINANEFSRTADFYLKYKCYTQAPKKTKEWYEFWREETRRCEEGFSAGGIEIIFL